jgi:hypothetical protein
MSKSSSQTAKVQDRIDGELRPLSSFLIATSNAVAVAFSRSFPEQFILSQVRTRIQLDHRIRQICASIVLDFFAFAIIAARYPMKVNLVVTFYLFSEAIGSSEVPFLSQTRGLG